MSSPVPVVNPRVLIDWAGDGLYADPASDVTRDTAADPGVEIDAGRDGARALNPPKVPAASFELRNDTARYSHENPASPVYQRIKPGVPVQVQARWGAVRLYRSAGLYRAQLAYRGVAVWAFATSRIDETRQTTQLGQQRLAVSTLGASSTLVGRAVSIPLQTSINTAYVIGLLLDAAGWPSDKRIISIGDTTLLYYWADERSCWDALLEVVAAEGAGAALYEDASGTIHFENRNYRAVNSRSVNSQAAFYDSRQAVGVPYRAARLYRADRPYRGQPVSLTFTDLAYEPGWRSLYARATYNTNRRALGTLQPVWSAGGDIVLSANQSRTLFARPQDPFQNAVSPVAGTDYQVTAGSVTVSMTYTSGFLAILTVTAGASGCTVTGPAATPTQGLQVRAQPLSIVSQAVVQSTVAVTSSDSAYRGVQTLDVAGWPEVDVPMAEAVCNSWASRYQVQRPQVTLSVYGGDHDHFEQLVRREVSDRISIRERNTGLQADVWIESKQLSIGPAGHVSGTWACEKCDAFFGYVWDGGVSLWGGSDYDPSNQWAKWGS
jgi:hypothetical protein